ncbi:unnamed protein product [Cochlearia groenlandica]
MPLFNNSSVNLAVAATLIFAGGLYICFSSRWISDPIISGLPHNFNTLHPPVDGLEAALEQAAKGNNKTVIIVMVNKAYVKEARGGKGMLDLFLESFWEGEETLPLLDHLLVMAADQTAYDRCQFRRLHCYKMETGGIDLEREKVYMSHEFIEMMWQLAKN